MRFHHNNKTTNFQRHRPVNGSVGLTKSKSKSTTIRAKRSRMRFSLLAIAAVFAVVGVAQAFNVPAAQADKYDEKIKALQSQIDGYNSRAGELAAAADTLNNKISELQNQQAQLQAEINLNNAKRDGLTAQIADNEAKLQVQSEALSKTLAEIYYGQKTTALDVLMNSNSVSDYVDKAARQDSMKDQITSSVNQIKDIKVQLEQQKVEVEDLMRQQQAQKSMLADSQQQQQKILADTQGQEEAYKGMVANSQKQITELQAERQRLLNSSKWTSIGGSSDYPFDGYARNQAFNYRSCLFRSFPFGGGTCARQCVSYVEWQVYVHTGRDATVSGNAQVWWSTWSSIRSQTPRANSAIVWKGSDGVGHIAWVEKVNSDTSIVIAQYNADLKGNFSRLEINPKTYMGDGNLLGYLYF